MTEINPVEEAMKARTQAKKDLACCNAKLARLGLALVALGDQLRYLDTHITRGDDAQLSDDGAAFMVGPDRHIRNEFRLDAGDIGEALRLLLARREALKNLQESEKALADLGHSI